MGKYSKGTYASKNLLRRYAHRMRFEKSIQLILSAGYSSTRLLDVGCGDGYFLAELSERIEGDLKGFPSLVKNVFRKMSASKGDTYYTWNRIGRSCLGKPIPECRGEEEYLFHMGFYFGDLERILDEYFVTVDKFYSPFSLFNSQLNSQVFYVLKKK